MAVRLLRAGPGSPASEPLWLGVCLAAVVLLPITLEIPAVRACPARQPAHPRPPQGAGV
jgi:hypothetical protein